MCLSLWSGKPLFGQSADSLSYPYKIEGIIRDDRGNPLASANIVSKGDGNLQVSNAEGKYYATVYNSKTEVMFMYYRYSSFLFCPDGRTNVDIVLKRQKGWKKNKVYKSITCP